ncbi:MAG: ribonuclease PH [Cyanobacteria bacterium P01_D01_bin.123]
MAWSRPDGRSPDAIRPVSFQREFTAYAPGSVLVKFGATHVLCTVTIAEGVPKFLADSGQGWLTAEYRMLPSATRDRHSRELYRLSGRTAEIQRLIGRSLRAAVDFAALGPRTLTVDADVLQADGGTRTAAITGAYVALHDACKLLQREGAIAAWPLLHPVAAISVGIVEGEAIADLCYEEDVRASVDCNVVMTGTGQFVEIQGTAEGDPFSRSELDRMVELANTTIPQLCQWQTEALAKTATTV